jgi:hypothetical protein
VFFGLVTREKRCRIDVQQLRNWKLLEAFQARVLPHLQRAPRARTEEDPRRTLQALDYGSAFLFAMLNPVFTSLNLLAGASHCQKMRQVTQAPFSSASFSDAQHWFHAQVLEKVARDLAREVQAKGLSSGGDPRLRLFLKELSAVDGTIIRAVQRMNWTPAPGHGTAVRLFVSFSVFDQMPEDWAIRPGNTHELEIFAQRSQEGHFYVADRLYSQRHEFLEELGRKGADFVIRLNNNVIMQPVQPERPLSELDRRAGVVWDRIVRLGVFGTGPVLRVVRVETPEHVFHLATSRQDLPAEIIALIYRHRWEIEVFFKWIKTILNCRHWLAESPQGAAIQLYTVLIAALLLMLWTGQRPNRRMVEFLRLYFIGFATEEELPALLARAARCKKS